MQTFIQRHYGRSSFQKNGFGLKSEIVHANEHGGTLQVISGRRTSNRNGPGRIRLVSERTGPAPSLPVTLTAAAALAWASKALALYRTGR